MFMMVRWKIQVFYLFYDKPNEMDLLTFCRTQGLCDMRRVLSRLELTRDGRHEWTSEGVERGDAARGVVI